LGVISWVAFVVFYLMIGNRLEALADCADAGLVNESFIHVVASGVQFYMNFTGIG